MSLGYSVVINGKECTWSIKVKCRAAAWHSCQVVSSLTHIQKYDLGLILSLTQPGNQMIAGFEGQTYLDVRLHLMECQVMCVKIGPVLYLMKYPHIL